MTIIFAEPETNVRAKLTDKAFALTLRSDADVPWWAIELLDLRKGTDEFRVRDLIRYSRPRGARFWNVFAELVERAEQTVMKQSIDAWRDLCYNDTDPDGTGGKIATIVRDAALFSPRAFVQLTDIRDHEGEPIAAEQFHVDMIRGMRQSVHPTVIECFWGGGKSFNSSIVVPLMDWAEERRATEGRIYLDEDTVKKWTGLLMQEVEGNDSLHKLFPWVSKPRSSDPGYKIWSYDGFAIAGNPKQIRSFEAHTIGASKTGFRFWRTGIDDIVSDKEARTASIQERNVNYIKRVALTMRQRTRRPTSKYRTVFPGIYTVGTPYDRGDANVQLKTEYKLKGYKVISIPIFLANRGADERPRWAAVHTPAAIQAMKEEMGPRAFNMRCRLEVGGQENSMFPEADVDWALKDGRSDPNYMQWCQVPPNTKLIIGFDPASGRRVAHHGARYPAFVVYGMRDANSWRPNHPNVAFRDSDGPQGLPQQPEVYHHVIQWGRMEGVGFHSQCQTMVELARVYNCPIAFEDNTLQASYGEEIAKIASDVQTFSHTTGMNKRDPSQGVEQFEPILHNRRLIIHADHAPPDQVKALRDELVGWPTHAFTDLVMALWIARYQFSLHIQRAAPFSPARRPLPAYVQRFAQPWYRERG